MRRTIGTLAREAGVNVETVRYYERTGLIDRPASAGGPRHYDDTILMELKYVKAAQGLGLSLAEIKSLKARIGEGKGFCASVRTIVAAKLVALAEERARIERLEAELAIINENCLKRAGTPGCPVLDALHTDQATHIASKSESGR